VDSFTTSAENGTPEIERRLIPPDSVLDVNALVVPPVLYTVWAREVVAQSSKAKQTKAQQRTIFMISPGRVAPLYPESSNTMAKERPDLLLECFAYKTKIPRYFSTGD
jgi:hypothetical protein